MSILSYRKRQIRDFTGAHTAPDPINVPANAAGVATNVEFNDGSVSTRSGFADTLVLPADVVSSFFNWVFLNGSAGQANQLVWFARGTYGGVQYANADSATPAVNNAYTVSGAYAASYAPHGARLYLAHFGTDGLGKDHARVLTFSGGATAVADKCFARPLYSTECNIGFSLGAGGKLTPGIKYVGFIAERRSGAILRPGPIGSSNFVFSPGLFTATANSSVTITITPTASWPADVVKIHLLMTTSTNKSRFLFVPGATATVTGSGAAAFTVTISDDDLVRNGDEATKYLNLACQDGAGNPPFSPIGVFRAGKRMAWCVNDANYPACVFFSEENNPQAVNVGKNVFYVPQYVHGGFEHNGLYVMLGPAWTYAAQDNGRFPTTWASAKTVDGGIGTPSPLGFAVNSSLGIGWVAARQGLYRFAGGSYDQFPLSDWQSDLWARINWAAGYAVQVVDDSVNRCVYVLAPLDAETVPTTVLSWNYQDGQTFDRAKFSKWTIAGRSIGGIGLIQNRTSKVQEVCIAPANASHYFQRKRGATEAPLYTDGAATGLDSTYRTAGLLQGKGETLLSQHHGDLLRVTGAGDLDMTAYSLDATKSASVRSVALSTTPNAWPLVRYYLLNEDARLELTNGGVAGAGFKLSAIEHLWTPHATQR